MPRDAPKISHKNPILLLQSWTRVRQLRQTVTRDRSNILRTSKILSMERLHIFISRLVGCQFYSWGLWHFAAPSQKWALVFLHTCTEGLFRGAHRLGPGPIEKENHNAHNAHNHGAHNDWVSPGTAAQGGQQSSTYRNCFPVLTTAAARTMSQQKLGSPDTGENPESVILSVLTFTWEILAEEEKEVDGNANADASVSEAVKPICQKPTSPIDSEIKGKVPGEKDARGHDNSSHSVSWIKNSRFLQVKLSFPLTGYEVNLEPCCCCEENLIMPGSGVVMTPGPKY